MSGDHTLPVGYVVRRMPTGRQPVLDRLAGASRRFQVHALVELDVSDARARIRRAPEPVTWTAFVIASVARAVALHPDVNARMSGSRIVVFDGVDIGATVERPGEGRPVLDIVVVRGADRLGCVEITLQLHEATVGQALPHPQRGVVAQVLRLPGPLRRTAIRLAARRPAVSATFGPAVGVTSIGMFTHGWDGRSRWRRSRSSPRSEPWSTGPWSSLASWWPDPCCRSR